MKVGILATDGGPHPADKWAEQSAAQIADIIHIDESSVAFDALNSAKKDFESKLTDALEAHHSIVQNHEIDAIDEHGMDRLAHPLEPEKEHLDDAVATVQSIADQSKMFGTHFRKPEVVDFVRQTIGSHFASAKHIERSWHADKNAAEPEAKAFKAKYHPGNK